MIKLKQWMVWVAAVVFSFIIIILYKCEKSNKTPKGKLLPAVTTMIVSKTRSLTSLKSIGTAVSDESVDIRSTVTQKIESIHFMDGEQVKKGQLLLQLNVDKRNAELKQAEISLQEQQRELKRLELLKDKHVVSEKDYDLQKTKLLNAKAQVEILKVETEGSSIRAPFDGVLGARRVSIGALITPDTSITTIDAIDRIKIDFTLPEKYSPLLNTSLKITAKNVAIKDKKFMGDVLAIIPCVSPVSRSISVRGIIDNSDHLIRPGMMLKISVKLGEREVIFVPEKAVANIGERHFVFVVGPNDTAKRRYVNIGERATGFVEIEDGLKVGDRVIVDGLSKLSDNDRVSIVKDETDSNVPDRYLLENEEE
ncbi:MAG: efflux RND transporter periplasmic adaptor subunit [Holosporaceae bacterium]|jgi:membrane fusion protein (multidrug efflux system)|nr:efflux RND transporter periplasmic adaptor subunit [Holosporaceae bacterium]